MEELLPLADLAGYVALALVLLYLLRAIGQLWRDGAFVNRALHDEIVAQGLARESRLETANAQLREQLTGQNRELERMARAVEKLAEGPTRAQR